MQAAQLRLYQGRFFLIPESECETFDKYRNMLEGSNSTAGFAQVHTAFWDRYATSELSNTQLENVQFLIESREKLLEQMGEKDQV
jgi:hypothetical protein